MRFSTPTPIAGLISGGGRTLANLEEARRRGDLAIEIPLVICSNPHAGGLERCRDLGLSCLVLSPSEFADTRRFSEAIFEAVRGAGAELVCLAGFLRRIEIPVDYAGRILNIHPSLLPEFGGVGMYGDRVHRAVLAAGRQESGCTVHYVTDEYDAGPIILQRRCAVEPGDTVSTLAARVFALECEAYPEAIRRVISGESRFTADDPRACSGGRR